MNKTVYLLKAEGKYIAAILQGTKALAKYMQKVDPTLLSKLEVEGLRGTYPFQILEVSSGGDRKFYVLDTDYLQKNFIKDLAKMKPFERPLTTYEITEDFLGDPETPGADYMGILNHDHIGEENEL
jgi:hypothetical protein